MFVEILSLLLDFNNVHQHVKDSKIPATKKSIGLFKIYIFIIFGCAGSLLLSGLFASCSEWGLLFSCSVRASH